jgi:hypothetical protein
MRSALSIPALFERLQFFDVVALALPRMGRCLGLFVIHHFTHDRASQPPSMFARSLSVISPSPKGLSLCRVILSKNRQCPA